MLLAPAGYVLRDGPAMTSSTHKAYAYDTEAVSGTLCSSRCSSNLPWHGNIGVIGVHMSESRIKLKVAAQGWTTEISCFDTFDVRLADTEPSRMPVLFASCAGCVHEDARGVQQAASQAAR